MKYQGSKRATGPPSSRGRSGPREDPMETFDMVNRHTEKLIRQAGKRAGKKPRKPSREEQIRGSVRRHRIRHKKNYILYYLLLLFLLLTVGTVLSLTVLFRIEHIQVEGAGALPVQEIIAASGIKKEDNLFRINTRRAETSILNQFITIDGVTLSRKLPSTVVITVEPSQLMAVSVYSGQYFSVSKGSRVISVSNERPEEPGIPLVIGCDYSDAELGDYLKDFDMEKNKLEILETVLEGIAEVELEDIGYIDLTDVAFIKLYYQDRLELKMGGLTDFAYELGRVRQLIEANVPGDAVGVIDATLHNGAYYYRDTGQITLPEERQDAQPPLAGIGHDLPGDERAAASEE
jgi:cell division septal protein FtsQ